MISCDNGVVKVSGEDVEILTDLATVAVGARKALEAKGIKRSEAEEAIVFAVYTAGLIEDQLGFKGDGETV